MELDYRRQTRTEEIINAATHGFGLLLASIAVPFLISKTAGTGNIGLLIASCVFAFGIIAVYFTSTLYHLLIDPVLKHKANIADHISIFFLIGGTYTPLVLLYTTSTLTIVFLSVQWTIIAMGAMLKIFFTGKYNTLSLALYVVLGWMLLFIIKPVYQQMPFNIFCWILAGGIAYSAGIIFYRLDNKTHAHNIWHSFVLAGTILHFIAIYKSVGYYELQFPNK